MRGGLWFGHHQDALRLGQVITADGFVGQCPLYLVEMLYFGHLKSCERYRIVVYINSMQVLYNHTPPNDGAGRRKKPFPKSLDSIQIIVGPEKPATIPSWKDSFASWARVG